MRMVIGVGKFITGSVWLIMLYNLVLPFPGQLSLIFNILLLITFVMHGVQAAIFHSLFQSLMPIKKKHYLQVLAFGVFTLLSYRQQLINTPSN